MATLASMQGSMPWRTCGHCIRRQPLRSNRLYYRNRFLSTTGPLRSAPKNPLRTSGNARTREEEIAQYRRSMTFSAAGIAACAVAMYGVIKMDLFGLEQTEEPTDSNSNKAMKLDGPGGFPSSPSVIRIQGQDGAEQVATGTSTIPYFPSTIRLPKSLDDPALKPGEEVPSGPGVDEEDYQLLGLGIRRVTFLQMQVYVVGLYVAKSDISELQQRLVRTAVHPPGAKEGDGGVIPAVPGAASATSLVSTERQALKQLLLDPEKGEDAWDQILRKDGLRTALRIVPTRNTDFLHLRDGWVRGITARAAKRRAAVAAGAAAEDEFQDESFGAAMNDFKALFGGGQRKSVPKGQTLLFMRNARGELNALFCPEAEPAWFLGRVSDERIGRLVWLHYLAGKTVASEEARQSVVDGVMGIVERPVGTVVQKVV